MTESRLRRILMLAGFATASGASDVASQGCTEYADYIHIEDVVALAGDVTSVARNGSYVYVAADDGGVHVIDASVPGTPEFVGTVTGSAGALALDASGEYLVIGLGFGDGIALASLTDAAAPEIIGEIVIDDVIVGRPKRVGSLVYGVGSRQLHIIDISDPTSPLHVSSLEVGDSVVTGVEVIGDVAFVTSWGAGLTLVDVSDPSNPEVLRDLTAVDRGKGIAVSETQVYVADDDALIVFDRADPANPVVLVSHAFPEPLSGVVAEDGHVYVLGSMSHLVEVAEDGSLVTLGSINAGFFSSAVRVGDSMFVPGGDLGLTVLDVSSPASPSPGGSLTLGGFNTKAVLRGSYLYVARGAPYLSIVDVRDPLNPVRVGSEGIAATSRAVDVVGDWAYVGGNDDKVHGFDIRDRALPRRVWSLDLDSACLSLVAHDGYVYAGVGVGGAGIYVIHVAPNGPEIVNIVGGASVFAMTVHENHLYASHSGSVRIYDLSDPRNPVQVNTVSFDTSIGRVAFSSGYAYLGNLIVCDASDPTDLVPIGTWPEGSDAGADGLRGDVAISDQFAYVVTTWSGMRVYDISDPTRPRHAGQAYVPGFSESVVAFGDHVLVTCSDPGVLVFTRQCGDLVNAFDPLPPLTSPISLAAPNPFRFETRISPWNGGSAGVRVHITNAGGRVLREWRGWNSSCALVWDGRDGSGNVAPAGVYWITVSDGVHRATEQVVKMVSER